MNRSVNQIALTVLVLAALFLGACDKERVRKPPPPRPPKPPAKVAVPVPEKQSPAAEARREIRELVRDGQFEAALLRIRGVADKGALGKDYGVLYENSLIGLLEYGDEYMEDHDYPRAGSAYRVVLDNYPSDEYTRKRLMRSAQELRQSIDICAGVLMEEGLREYRRGMLEKAIATWNTVISFDPANEEALKARDTAITQLENLKKME